MYINCIKYFVFLLSQIKYHYTNCIINENIITICSYINYGLKQFMIK